MLSATRAVHHSYADQPNGLTDIPSSLLSKPKAREQQSLLSL